ncbi:hypothetical protein [uncultured Draconibacterium sp.]|uniref:hypothetical protein n=1 Tax=uncultured Draconibacterium sp. TaxID=1573823 RepID=UPI0025DFBAB6|nr:hypothetical protein [uncultured Draconibacterium sp.]
MKAITKEEEYKLIGGLLAAENQIRKQKIEFQFCTDDAEIVKIESSITELIATREQLALELTEIENPQASIEIRHYLIQMFYEMRASIMDVKYDLPISRNQGLVLENYFISKIYDEIKRVMNCKHYGLSRPFLYFSADPEDSFDRKELISFFNSEIEILQAFDIVNYILLKDYFEKFAVRLSNLIQ